MLPNQTETAGNSFRNSEGGPRPPPAPTSSSPGVYSGLNEIPRGSPRHPPKTLPEALSLISLFISVPISLTVSRGRGGEAGPLLLLLLMRLLRHSESGAGWRRGGRWIQPYGASFLWGSNRELGTLPPVGLSLHRV